MLKNVGTPSSMLETVVSEKSVTHKPTPLSPKPSAPSTNERIKGLLRRESRNYSTDKVFPAPTPPPHSPSPANGTPLLGHLNGESIIGTPSLGTPSQPSTPRPDPNPGFKQVAAPTTPEVSKSPLPSLPIPPSVSNVDVRSTAELTPPIRPPRTSSLEGKLVIDGHALSHSVNGEAAAPPVES